MNGENNMRQIGQSSGNSQLGAVQALLEVVRAMLRVDPKPKPTRHKRVPRRVGPMRRVKGGMPF